jgi:hypothetical protein
MALAAHEHLGVEFPRRGRIGNLLGGDGWGGERGRDNGERAKNESFADHA